MQGADELAIVARFGVGYDSVDVAACNEQGVLLTITPDGVRRPVAVMALTYLLALSHKMLAKDRLVREGRWHERLDYIGMGITGSHAGAGRPWAISAARSAPWPRPSAFAALPPTLSSMLHRARAAGAEASRTRPVAAKCRLRLHLLRPH